MLATLAGCRAWTPAGPSLSVRHDTGNASSSLGSISIVLSGLETQALAQAKLLTPEELPALLALYVGAETHSPSQPPVVGNYRIADGCIILQPRFRLQPGLSYHAAADPQLLATNIVTPPLGARFTIPAVSRKPKRTVAHIYPSAEVLPENLLKFYLHFSGPMSRGGIYQYVKLLKADGTPVDLPFLEIGEELWDRELTRLTLLIDPGRIKREINPIENLGPALQAGHEYTLVVDAAWPDAEGVPLRATYRKHFRVTSPDRTPPDPHRWDVKAPKRQSRQPLRVLLGESLDHALASRLIQVRARDGMRVEGEVRLADEERRWEFVPARPWQDADYEIVATRILEDLAGNSIGRPFEVDMAQPLEPAPPMTLRFHPR